MQPSIINALTNNVIKKSNNRMEFKSGQLFYGTVKNIYPNQTATVQVGRFTLVAKLEVPLVNGNGYWFQVTKDEGEIHLKTISTKINGDSSEIMKQLSLPNSKGMKAVVSYLADEQFPLSKENIIKAISWMEKIPKNSGLDSGLDTIKFMAEKDFPFTETIFRSLLQSKQSISTNSLLQLLQNQLQFEEKSETAQSLLSVIHALSKENNAVAKQVIQTLLDRALNDHSGEQAGITNAILKKIGLLESTQSFITAETVASKSQQAKPFIDMINIPASKVNQDNLNSVRVSLQLNQELPDSVKQSIRNMDHLLKNEPNQLLETMTEEELNHIKKIEQDSKSSLGRQEALSYFKDVTKKLGIFYEADLNTIEKPKNLEETLKPLLIKYLDENEHPKVTKDIAEQMLLKLNSQQLLSHDSGPIQHLLYEIPINLFGFKTDLTMQWSGKRTEDGKIDPDFCHILFYLNLEHIDETVVEMKVQSRIISLNVYNNHPNLKEFAKLLIPKLKEGLSEVNYILSAIQFIDSVKDDKGQNKQNGYKSTTTYSRMDFKI